IFRSVVREATNPNECNRCVKFNKEVNKSLDKHDMFKSVQTVESHPNCFKKKRFKSEEYPMSHQLDAFKRTQSKTGYIPPAKSTCSKAKSTIHGILHMHANTEYQDDPQEIGHQMTFYLIPKPRFINYLTPSTPETDQDVLSKLQSQISAPFQNTTMTNPKDFAQLRYVLAMDYLRKVEEKKLKGITLCNSFWDIKKIMNY
ncbi:MAG: hypothetical protein AAGC43_18535, partial [Bacteroidota bacterium]